MTIFVLNVGRLRGFQGVQVLNYIDDWLILAQSRTELLHHRSLILNHKCLGIRINLSK